MAQLGLTEVEQKLPAKTKPDDAMAWIDAPETVRCPYWCGGNHDEAHPDDRVHWSTDTPVFEPVLADPAFQRIGGETREIPLRLLVTMEQGFREIGPRVSLAPETLVHGRGFAFTMIEAETIARQILRLIELSRSQDGC